MRVYQIVVDRFSTGNPSKDAELARKSSNDWMGGNLKGVISKIDYISNLGFDAIWLSPIFKCYSYHGYNITSFFDIDPRFGNKELLRELIKQAHKRDLKIILDFVPNHVSEFHPFFLDAKKNKNSKYRDWFIFKKWPDDYMCFEDVKGVPKLNLENQDTRNYMLEVAEYWISEFEIDGYRLDHAIGPPFDFWKDLIKLAKSYTKEFLFLPELLAIGAKPDVFDTFWFMKDNPEWKKEFAKAVEERMNGDVWVWQPWVKNPSVEKFLLKVFKKHFETPLNFVTNFYIRRAVKLNEEINIKLEKKHFHFMDNHDMKRISELIGNDSNKLLSILEFLLEAENIVFYYGTEVAFYNNSITRMKSRSFMNWSIANEKNNFFKKVKEILTTNM